MVMNIDSLSSGMDVAYWDAVPERAERVVQRGRIVKISKDKDRPIEVAFGVGMGTKITIDQVVGTWAAWMEQRKMDRKIEEARAKMAPSQQYALRKQEVDYEMRQWQATQSPSRGHWHTVSKDQGQKPTLKLSILTVQDMVTKVDELHALRSQYHRALQLLAAYHVLGGMDLTAKVEEFVTSQQGGAS
jgi:hypothetical protein